MSIGQIFPQKRDREGGKEREKENERKKTDCVHPTTPRSLIVRFSREMLQSPITVNRKRYMYTLNICDIYSYTNGKKNYSGNLFKVSVFSH